uniref:Uncharacterized protein n=1 Tax=Rhizophora mucronata TaxID=61149 RepID=A0A2P2PN59_RHIMU
MNVCFIYWWELLRSWSDKCKCFGASVIASG